MQEPSGEQVVRALLPGLPRTKLARQKIARFSQTAVRESPPGIRHSTLAIWHATLDTCHFPTMLHHIEQAIPVDFLEIAALDRAAWVHTGETFIPDGEHVWRVWCEYATVLVCRSVAPNPIGGTLLMFPTVDGEEFLHKIMVHPDQRGRGIGTDLMRAGLARANAPVLLTVDPENAAAVKLYENFGFTVRRRVDGYYRGHEHRYIMVHPGSSGLSPPCGGDEGEERS